MPQNTGCSFYVSTFKTWITRVRFVRFSSTRAQNIQTTLGFYYILHIEFWGIIRRSRCFQRKCDQQYLLNPSFLENLTAFGLTNEVLWIFLWGYIKSKIHVKNYESRKCRMECWIEPWRTSVDDWEWSFGIRERVLKNKAVMCLYVVYIKILMLSKYFEPKLMKIARIEL